MCICRLRLKDAEKSEADFFSINPELLIIYKLELYPLFLSGNV